jgi:hypothetical protein
MNALTDLTGADLDIEGVVGDDLEFAVFFGYHPITGFTFSSFIELSPPPLPETFPLAVEILDGANGLIGISLEKADTEKLGPISGRPWKLSWIENGKTLSVLMGKFALNRM